MGKMTVLLLAMILSMSAGGKAETAKPGGEAAAPEAVLVPFTVHGHAVDSGQGDGRSYYYIVLAEQIREVPGIEVTFIREGIHQVWAIGYDGATIQVGSGICGKGTYQIPVTKEMARLEFYLFTEEVPYLGLEVPGGMAALNTPYAGHYLSILGDSLSEADNWKLADDDPDAYNMTSQWWYAAAREFGMNLLTNNSVGSTGVYQESAEGRLDSGLQRCTSLHTAAREPDDIFVLLGANDLLSGHTIPEIAAGYKRMVETMQERYPEANIVLFTYPHFGSVETFDQYVPKVDALNAAIRMIALECDTELIELGECPFTSDNIGQYLRNPNDIHFDRSGQAVIGAEAVRKLYVLTAEKAAAAAG